MTELAGMAMEMKAAQFSTAYSTAMLKKTMESQEEAASIVTEMLASVPTPAVQKGEYIDTYA